MIAVFHTSVWMALSDASSSKPCKTATESKKTKLSAMHRLTTDAGAPFASAVLHGTIKRKEASGVPEYLFVIGKDGKPQMPTKRKRHIQHLLKTGKVRIAEEVPFTVQLLYENTPVLQPVLVAEDPGRTNIGVAAIGTKGERYFSAVVETRNKEIPSNR